MEVAPKQNMLLRDLVHSSRQVTDTSSRLEKIRHLRDCLTRLTGEEIEIGVQYLTGQLRQGNIGIGPALLGAMRSVEPAGRSELTLAEVDLACEQIQQTTGPGSSRERQRQLGVLFGKATKEEQDFLVRLMLGELRQGALEGVMVEAIARASDVAASDVRRALMLAGDLAAVARVALTEEQAGLGRFKLQLLNPLHPMLAQPAEDIPEALAQFSPAAFEYKMDGARIQVHKDGEDIRVFSRTLNDVTASVPDVVAIVHALPPRTLILDGEALAFRPDGIPHPFQITMRRFGRKLDVERLRQTLPLTPFFFDCLHVDGEDLIDRPTVERAELLQQIVPGGSLTPRFVTDDPARADAFLHEALSRGHEGVMAKAPGAGYEAGRRGSSWLKIKRAHTLDLVVLAAEWGHGRRRGWLSNLHLGARDPEHGGYVMLGKTFKGMTDAMLDWQTQKLQALEIGRDEWTVYVRPELVVEIAFNDIQASPHYPGGLALRFARVKRYRPDKLPEQADTIEAVRAVYARQVEGAATSGPPV